MRLEVDRAMSHFSSVTRIHIDLLPGPADNSIGVGINDITVKKKSFLLKLLVYDAKEAQGKKDNIKPSVVGYLSMYKVTSSSSEVSFLPTPFFLDPGTSPFLPPSLPTPSHPFLPFRRWSASEPLASFPPSSYISPQRHHAPIFTDRERLTGPPFAS